jgi:hypothetical protein
MIKTIHDLNGQYFEVEFIKKTAGIFKKENCNELCGNR